jgi:orotidine-5'-phosphate decarboxylase
VLALCHTSNAGSGEVQDLDAGGRPLFERVATMVATRWSELGDAGLVVGATFPAQLAAVRAIAGDLPILVPGVGAQGGDLGAAVTAGATGPGTGMLISSSRAVLYASRGDDFADAARAAARRTRDAIGAAVSPG